VEHLAGIGSSKNIYRNLLGKLEGRRPLEIKRCRWEDTVKTDLKEAACDGLELTHHGQGILLTRVRLNLSIRLL